MILVTPVGDKENNIFPHFNASDSEKVMVRMLLKINLDDREAGTRT